MDLETQLLAGIKVVSLAQQYPGPYATMLLADLGADVILVEQPGTGDPARGPDGMSNFFAALNRNKRSVTVDLKTAPGAEALRGLLATADALIEGFRPGVMDRLGFSPGSVREQFPKLVYVSISGYGHDSTDRFLPGHDLSYVGRAGLLAGVPEASVLDYRLPVAVADLSSGMFAALATLAALLGRVQTGIGAYIDVSMTDGLVSWMGTSLEALFARSEPTITAPASVAGEPGYGIFRCSDGKYITVSIAYEDHFWRGLCRALELDLESLSASERRHRSRELRTLLERGFELAPASHWLAALREADVPSGPVSALADVISDPLFLGRGMFPEAPGEAGGLRRFVANPLVVDGQRPAVRRPAPHLGEHNDDLFGPQPGR